MTAATSPLGRLGCGPSCGGSWEFRNPRPPLATEVLWRREHELGTIEKITFTCEPGSDAVAFVCLPRNVQPPYPFFICLQGHSTGMHLSIGVDRDDNSQAIVVERDYDFGLGCLRRGVAALCLEQRAFGERREQHQEIRTTHGCQDAAMHALMLGRTLAGERTFDVGRALDYLETRDDVDWARVGAMGNSGGGTITMFAAALHERLRFAMPSCSFCTFRDSIMAIRHCVDNYIPGLLVEAEMADVMGLFAPRPLVIVAGQDDPIFPVEATRTAFAALERIYRAAGAEENCRLVIGPEGHRFYAELGWGQMLPMLGMAR
ncbi:MAG: hypothetical protein HC897_11055 [Thermoanaerobaculia bacterium]|nr:hypothetical protein [Thermoanaerobaculia bacterium]